MQSKFDTKTIYAQSSDIKSRTYLQYRKDMKQKAIVELEVLPWLEAKFKSMYQDNSVKVLKSGGDEFLWFLRAGGIKRDADFKAVISSQGGLNKEIDVELQYANTDIKENSVFDFKVSKVAKKIKGEDKLIAKETIFLYLFKLAPCKYAFIDAQWIMQNGYQGTAPAWGNRDVYKVEGKNLIPMLKEDRQLEYLWSMITAKSLILNFQHELIEIQKNQLSYLLQQVVDANQLVKIIPKDLISFFKICFILDSLNKVPNNANLWLIYVLSFINKNNDLKEIFMITYCVDFLYSKINLQENEIIQFTKGIVNLKTKLQSFYQADGSYKSSPKESPLDETRYALFAINLLEDLTQDAIYYYTEAKTQLKPVIKIYECIGDVQKTANFISFALNK